MAHLISNKYVVSRNQRINQTFLRSHCTASCKLKQQTCPCKENWFSIRLTEKNGPKQQQYINDIESFAPRAVMKCMHAHSFSPGHAKNSSKKHIIIKGVTEAVSLTYFEVVSPYSSTGLFIFVSIVLRKHCLKGGQLSPRSNE